jgi:preprotein translocase SecE subunit
MSKDDATWLNVAYVCFFLLVAYMGYKAVETLGIQTGWMERYEWFTYVTSVGGFGIGAAATWYLRADKERHQYLLSSITELRKVTWPNWPDTKRMTIIVCVVVAIFAVILGLFDMAWQKALALLLT